MRRDFDLPWLGTNAHFVSGMFGFSYLIVLRTLFREDTHPRLANITVSIALSGLLLMVGIVNRGVASGSGDGMRYGTNVFYLFKAYTQKLVEQAIRPSSFGPLELSAVALMLWSVVASTRAVWKIASEETQKKD